jgi:hypothetical protein
MKGKLLIQHFTVICVLSLFILSPTFSSASDSEILNRLEKMEQQILDLKKENTELTTKIK